MHRGRTFIVGGAGFLGSHLVDELLRTAEGPARVTVVDDFSSGSPWHLAHHVGDPRLSVIRADAADTDGLAEAMAGHEVVVHLASNADIGRAAADPTLDFRRGTVLTQSVVEAARSAGPRQLIYASGSGVYGDRGEAAVAEDDGPFAPISPYGASKLAGEALVSAYAHLFGFTGLAFRFANLVGPRQTHGVGLDFLRGLLSDPTRLRVLGDGRQAKSYVHVDDAVRAVRTVAAQHHGRFRTFNVAGEDTLEVSAIAGLAIDCLGLSRGAVSLELAGGARGWKGDVPYLRLATERIRACGWRCALSSAEAMRRSLEALAVELQGGRP